MSGTLRHFAVYSRCTLDLFLCDASLDLSSLRPAYLHDPFTPWTVSRTSAYLTRDAPLYAKFKRGMCAAGSAVKNSGVNQFERHVNNHTSCSYLLQIGETHVVM